MLEVIQDPHLAKLASIQHGFFTRQGGISSGWYESLNCSYTTPDSPDNVRENRRRVMSHFGLSLDALVTVKNVHGNQAVIVDRLWSEQQKPQADAMVTNQRKIMLGTDSADCPIVLFADEKSHVIGLAHAGWRGAKNGIIESTIEKMISLGAKTQHMIASISPCIAQDSYEVSEEFHQQFLDEHDNNEIFFRPSIKENHFHFDLPSYVKNRLLKFNLKLISNEVAFDTYPDEKRFFSCRRSFHRGEDDFGGHFSCIYMI